MSSRQLRKLQKQRELEELQAQNPVDDLEESEEDLAPAPKSKPSVFSGFAPLGSQGDQDEDDEDDDGDPAEPVTEPADTPSLTDTVRSSSKKSKKKKKKAKKAEATPKAQTAAQDEQDEIDRALKELSLSKKMSGTAGGDIADTSSIKAYERICELLRINTYHLKVVNEMRNLFGREAIAAAEQENEERARASRPRQPLQQQVDLETFLKGPPGKTLPEVTLRRNPFLPGKDTWPRASTEGLTMKLVKDRQVPGVSEFSFAHDDNYNALERQFFTLVQMHDPMQLVAFLQRHPYHISSLIQVSKVAKQDQNSALAGDLCERALFTFGRVSLSAFRQKVDEGKARLDFRRPENRQFWLAGYHYLKSLVMKGTYRTALEWSKLLLSLDIEDPYGIIHFIHPMAIRAHESKWFIDFCDSEALDNCDTAGDYIRQTLVLARLQQEDTAGAKALVLEGMEQLPWLYSSLYKALNLDVPKAIWGIQPRDQHEEFFTELYVHQTKSLWDNAQALGLLKGVSASAKKPDLGAFAVPPVVGRNAARFVYLDNTPSLMGLVPDGLLSTSPNWEFDPLPPPEGDNIFSHESQRIPWQPRQAGFQPGLQGIDLPNDPEGLRAALERLRQLGVPREFEQALQEVLDATQNGQAGEGLEGDEDVLFGDEEDRDDYDELERPEAPIPPVGMGNMFQTFLNLFNPGTTGHGGEDYDDDLDSEDLPWGTMPGAWGDDPGDESSDVASDELLPLIPADGDGDGNATDDDMPGLV
ncbi:Uu.00g068470.m01.CDS01 [Anthostomella pinea]|uniref:Uu.00g068470.m01.CDS01 n=1 Tax=Anthostomella pinea TaxID=933095 RepID=A0AAI8YL26_9PEZI|nr:Uu.00g068470.m01.CDS01 [Anthostomella pinea]